MTTEDAVQLAIFVICLASAVISDRIAKRKGVRHVGFAMLGLLIGPFAILVVYLRDPRGMGKE